MSVFELKLPDGRSVEIDAPDAQSAYTAYQSAIGGAPSAPDAAQVEQEAAQDAREVVEAANLGGPTFGETQAAGVRAVGRGVGQTLDVVANPVNWLIDKLAGTQLGQRPFERGSEKLLSAVGVPEIPREGSAIENIIEFVSGLGPGAGFAKTISKAAPEVAAIPKTIEELLGQVAAKQAPITGTEVIAAGGAGAGMTAGQEIVEGIDSKTAKFAVPLITSILSGLGIVSAPSIIKGTGKQIGTGIKALGGGGDIPVSQVGVDITDEFKKVLGLPEATTDVEISQIVAQRVAQKADELRQSGLSDVEITEIISVGSVFPELKGSALFRSFEGADDAAIAQKSKAEGLTEEARTEALPEGDDTAARAFLTEELTPERAAIEKAAQEAELAVETGAEALVKAREFKTGEKAGQALTAEVEAGKKIKQAEVSKAYDDALGEVKDRVFETKPLADRMDVIVKEMGMTDMPTLKAAIDKVKSLDQFEGVAKFSEFEQAVNNVNVKEMTDNEKRVWMLAKRELSANLDDMAEGNIKSLEEAPSPTGTIEEMQAAGVSEDEIFRTLIRKAEGEAPKTDQGELFPIPEMVEKLDIAKGLAAEKGKVFKALGTGGKKTAVTPAGQLAKGKILPEKAADAFVHGGVDDAKNFRAATKQLDDVGKKRAETALKDGLVNKFFDDLGNWKDVTSGQKNFVKWYNQNRPALKELGADFDKQFATPAAAIEALKKAKIDQVAYNSTLRNKILTDVLDNPHTGWSDFRKTAGKDIVKQSRRALAAIRKSDNPEALKKSLQASYGEYLGNTYSTPEKLIKLFDGTTSELKLERQVMETMMDKKQINALRRMVAFAQEAEKIKIKIDKTPGKAALEEIASLSKTLVGNIWLAFMGATIMSPKTALTRGAYRGAKGKTSILRTQNMKEIMGRAFADPDYLVKLLQKTSPKKAQEDMKVYLWMARDRSKDDDDE